MARWLDDGITPNGAHGRAFGERGVHGFDLTFCAPKSVSLVRALRTDDVMAKAIADAHTTALSEAMEYLAAHAGYTRVHNPRTGEKDLVRLPGLAAIAYQHETSRCGDPHLHTHVIVPNRQARADGQLVSIDGTSLYHEAKRRRSHLSGHPAPGTAPVDGVGVGAGGSVDRDGGAGRGGPRHHHRLVPTIVTVARVGRPQPQRRRGRLAVGGAAGGRAESHPPGQTRRAGLGQLLEQWRADERGLQLDRASFDAARAARRAPARTPFDRARLADAAEKIDKAAFTRADLIEIVGAQLPVDTERTPRELVEAAVDEYRSG